MEEVLSDQVKSDENSDGRDINAVVDCPKESKTIAYFNCEKCFITVNIHNAKENVDPNCLLPSICKNCKAKELYANNFSEEVDDSSFSKEEQEKSAMGYSSVANSVIGEVLSPLTTSNTPESSLSFNQHSEKTGLSLSKSMEKDVYSIGNTHIFASSSKAPKNNSSFTVVNFYQPSGIFDSDLELQLKDGIDKRLDKFYAGMDVIYKPDRVFCCLPLLCPAKVFWEVGKETHCEMIVGITVDSHGNAYPIKAIYDSFHQFKNFAKERTVIHALFTRYKPISIKHNFTPEEMLLFSKELYKFLHLKTALEEKDEEILQYQSVIKVSKLKIQELMDSTTKHSDSMKKVTLENKTLKAESLALKKDMSTLRKQLLKQTEIPQSTSGDEQLPKKLKVESSAHHVGVKKTSGTTKCGSGKQKKNRARGEFSEEDSDVEEPSQYPEKPVRTRGSSKISGSKSIVTASEGDMAATTAFGNNSQREDSFSNSNLLVPNLHLPQQQAQQQQLQQQQQQQQQTGGSSEGL